MKRLFALLIGLGATSVAIAQETRAQLEITLKRNDQREMATKEQLLRLLATYDATSWIFTRSVVIESGLNVIPHSHPVLTLSTRHLQDDELLLSTFVHEQLHWYIDGMPDQTRAAVAELRLMFPTVPVGSPDGARDEQSTYIHILVGYLEFQANKSFFGELQGKQVMQFWATDHYRWIYRTILERERDIRALMRKHGLVPIERS
jgi:hypothetical protein